MRRHFLFATVGIAFLIGGCNQPATSPQVVRQLYVHKYGVSVPKNDWETRGSHGQIVTTFRDGTTVTRSYTAGILNGVTSKTYPHSDILQKTKVYDNGQLVRKTLHYASGLPYKETSFLAPEHTKTTVWYEDGTPQSIEELQNGYLLSGQYFTPGHDLESTVKEGEGTRVIRDAYGHLYSQESIEEGQLASQTTFYPNGDPETMASFKNGVLEGIRKTYFIGGEPNTIEEWASGYQHGTTAYFQNGIKKAEVTFIFGKKQGLERHFDDRGNTVEEISWTDNKKHGPTKIYVDGIVKTEWYYNNNPVTQAQFEAPRHVR